MVNGYWKKKNILQKQNQKKCKEIIEIKRKKRTGNVEVTGSNPVEALIFFFFFFRASSFQLLKLENLMR